MIIWIKIEYYPCTKSTTIFQSMSSLSLLLILELVGLINAQSPCEFKDSGGSGAMLYLEALAHTKLSYENPNTSPHIIYDFTPCRGALTCGSYTAMAIKYPKDNESECTVMTNYDTEITKVEPLYQPTYGMWTFNWTNGNKCNDESDDLYQFSVNYECVPDGPDYKVAGAGIYDILIQLLSQSLRICDS